MSTNSLIKQIREAVESEEFELANFEKPQVETLVNSLFVEPFEAPNYIRLTFVVGGGKKVRSKFREQLSKEFIEALRGVGYTEDRAASACKECQKTYKYQHDTDKDLKYVHVFPEVVIKSPEESGDHAGDSDGEELRIAGLSISEMPPEILATVCPLDVFVIMLAERCPTFSQRRSLFKRMKEVEQRLKSLEDKMIRMETLSSKEQELYDNALEMPAKFTTLTSDMEAMIEQGFLSMAEIAQLLAETQDKLAALDEKIASAAAEGKKTVKLEAQRSVLQQRMGMLENATPIVHTKPHDQEIAQLRKRLRGLEMKANGPKATLDDISRLAAIGPNIKVDIAALEEEDRGWFEDEIPKPAREEKATAAPKAKAPGFPMPVTEPGWTTVGKGKKR